MKMKLKNNGYSYMDFFIAERIKEERVKRGYSLLLGHARISMTLDTYSHLYPNELEKLMS